MAYQKLESGRMKAEIKISGERLSLEISSSLLL